MNAMNSKTRGPGRPAFYANRVFFKLALDPIWMDALREVCLQNKTSMQSVMSTLVGMLCTSVAMSQHDNQKLIKFDRHGLDGMRIRLYCSIRSSADEGTPEMETLSSILFNKAAKTATPYRKVKVRKLFKTRT